MGVSSLDVCRILGTAHYGHGVSGYQQDGRRAVGGPMVWTDKVRACVDWSEEDRARLAEVRGWLDPRSDEVIEDLGDQLIQVNGARSLMTNARFTRRLRSVLREWLTGVLCGTFDDAYSENRKTLGRKLADVDLGFEDVILLEQMAVERLFELAQERLDGQPQRLSSLMQTLNKAMNCDLALVYDGCLDVRDAEMERALLDRFLTVTGFSPTLYESLVEAWRWNQQQAESA